MPRAKGWEELLHAEVERGAARHTAWHKGEALLWVATCVARMRGHDPLPVEVGESRLKVARTITLSDMATLCRWPEVQPAFAQRGDVVLIGNTAGVVALDGRRVWVPVNEGNVGRLRVKPLGDATQAWRID